MLKRVNQQVNDIKHYDMPKPKSSLDFVVQPYVIYAQNISHVAK